MADDEDESLDEILSGPTTEPAEEPTTEEQPEAPVRDEHGRFAPKAEAEPEPEPAPEPDGEPDAEHPDNKAPPGLIEERRKRQAADARADKLERDLAEMRGTVNALMQRTAQPAQPQKEPEKVPDFWESPDKFVAHQITPIQQALREQQIGTSRMLAEVKFGEDTVTAAEKALEDAAKANPSDPGIRAEYQRIMGSPHPYAALVTWHKRQAALSEIGEDPVAYRERVRAELMAELGSTDPTKQPSTPAQPSRAPVVKLPPSLSKVPAGHAAPERDETLDEVLSQPRRRA